MAAVAWWGYMNSETAYGEKDVDAPVDAVARSNVTLTMGDYREWLDGTHLKVLNTLALPVALLLMFICAVLLPFDAFFHIANHDIMMEAAGVAAVLLAMRFIVPIVFGYVAFKRARPRGGAVEHEVAFFGDRVEAGGENGELVVFYEDVERTDQTEHLFVMTCKKQGALIVKKEAFSSEELAAIERLTKGSAV